MRALFKKTLAKRGIANSFYNAFNNLQQIQSNLKTASKVVSIVGMVFSVGVGFYSFQYIITSLNSLEVSLAVGSFAFSTLSFVQLAKFNYYN